MKPTITANTQRIRSRLLVGETSQVPKAMFPMQRCQILVRQRCVHESRLWPPTATATMSVLRAPVSVGAHGCLLPRTPRSHESVTGEVLDGILHLVLDDVGEHVPVCQTDRVQTGARLAGATEAASGLTVHRASPADFGVQRHLEPPGLCCGSRLSWSMKAW